jgi:hypothetical protein
MPSRIQLRRDTAANWTAINPVLAQGEPGLDTTIDLLKYGDGVTAWNNLPYSGSNPGAVGNIIPALSNTYTLGNATNSWQSLYVSGNTIYLGAIELGSNATELLIDGVPVPVLGGNVSFDSVHANANITTDGFISATGNISAGNLAVANNVVISGNLTVSGNAIYDNVTSFNVQDPIIGLGRAANNQPLTTNDGKDRGEQLWYFDGTEKSAFTGYDNSTGKITVATDVTITNEVVSVNNYGNFVAGNIEGASASVTGNITGNVVSANVANISANVTAGNLNAAGLSLSGNVVSNLNVTSNIAGGNIKTPGIVSAVGNITTDNTVIANVVSANTINITSGITANNISVSGNVTANLFVGSGAVLTDVMADRGVAPNNWNTMTQMGVYTVNRTSWSGTTGTPLDSQVFVGLVEVKNSTNTALEQIYFPGTLESGNAKIQWNRTYWAGSWSSWLKIVNDEQVVVGGSY